MRRYSGEMRQIRPQKGSSLLEFAFVLPVGVAFLAAALSLAVVSLRAIQAGQLARDVVLLADSGVDFGSTGGQQRLAALGKELGLVEGRAAVVISRVVREPGGFRVESRFQMGDARRLGLASDARQTNGLPEAVGESVWVVEVAAESGAFAPMLPEVVRARNVL